MIQTKRLKPLAAVLTLSLLIAAAGCSAPEKNSSASSGTETAQAVAVQPADSSASDAAKAAAQTITVYFPDANGEKLIPVQRQIDSSREDKYAAAVQTLIDGPVSDAEGIYIMPKGTKLLGVTVQDGTATVDFSREFGSGFAGGSTSEIMLIGSIVDTLTQFDEIKTVRFTVEGKPIDSLSGHFDLTEPQQRMEDLLNK